MALILNGTTGITDVNGTAAAPAITGTDTDTGVFFGTNTVSLSTGGTERLQVDSSGNLGLGVTPSAWGANYKALNIKRGDVFQNSTLNWFGIANNAYNDGTNWIYKESTVARMFRIQNDQFEWHNAASGTAGNAITFTQAMTLDASGNLGVGTTSPSGTIGAGYTSRLTAYASSNAAINIKDVNGDWFLGTTSANLTFYSNTAGAERARIDSSGNLLVGTTSNTGSRRFLVVQPQNTYSSEVVNTGSSPYGFGVTYSAASPNATGNEFFVCADSTNVKLTVRSNGGIANYQANNVNLSDSREKTNFAPACDYLAKICAIPVQTFNYIDQNLEEDDGLTLGVVAQDVQAVAPELVMESNWAKEGDEPKMRLSIYQTDLQYALMKCIQEQQAIITQLQADVAALKGNA